MTDTPTKLRSDEMLIELRHGFWIYAYTRKYRGSCTVWFDAETGKRANTGDEVRLHEIWNQRRKEATQ